MNSSRTPDAASVRESLESSVAAHRLLLEATAIHETLARWAETCVNSITSSGRILFAGNGGSFADAQHLAAEFTGRMLHDRQPLAGIALGTNSSSMSAIGNDYGFDSVFSREVLALGRSGDVLIALSTSGNSANLLAAVSAAQSIGIHCFGITGSHESKLSSLCEVIQVPASRTDRIQELHILLGHIMCSMIDDAIRDWTS